MTEVLHPGIKSPRRRVTAEDVDWPWLQSLEGGQILKAYVPLGAHTKSGTTVASGVDIGQMSEAELMVLPISDSLKEKLKPYTGKKSTVASDYLIRHPLVITKDEAEELDKAVFSRAINYVARAYMTSVLTQRYKSIPDFLDLPLEVRSVMASVAWHLGANLYKACPRLWGYLCANDWRNCQRELNNFYGKRGVLPGFINRRKAEAKKLMPLTGNINFEDFPDKPSPCANIPKGAVPKRYG